MKVSYKQLKAIIKLFAIVAQSGEVDDRESENIVRFLQEFNLDFDKIKEMLHSANQMELKEALSIIEELDQPTQQEVSNRLFNLIMADGEMSSQECDMFTPLLRDFGLPVPDTEEWKEWISKIASEVEEEEILSNEEDNVTLASDDENALCFFVIEPTKDAYFLGNCWAYVRTNRTVLSDEVIARNVLKCKKSTLLEWKNPPILKALTEDMGYTSYGAYRACIAKVPSDATENKAASKLIGTKVYGPCMIKFVSNEGAHQYFIKSYCDLFHKYLQKRLDCSLTYSYKYIAL